MDTRYSKLVDKVSEEKLVSTKQFILDLTNDDIFESVVKFLPNRDLLSLISVNLYFKDFFLRLPPSYALEHFQWKLNSLDAFEKKEIRQLQSSIRRLEARVIEIVLDAKDCQDNGYIVSGACAVFGLAACWVGFLPQLFCGPCGPPISGPFGTISCLGGSFYPLTTPCVVADGCFAAALVSLPCTLNFENCYSFSQGINSIKQQITVQEAILEIIPERCDTVRRGLLSKLSFFIAKLEPSVLVEEEKNELSVTEENRERLEA